MRMLAWSSGSLLGVFALFVCLVLFAVATPAGSRFVLAQIESRLDNQLVIGDFSGAITGPFSIEGLQFKSDTFQIKLDRIELDWLPSVLFLRRDIHIENVQLQGLQVILSKPEAATNVPTRTGLPNDLNLLIPIQIDKFALDNATMVMDSSKPDELVSIQSVLATELSWADDRIEIQQLSIESPLLDVTGRGNVRPLDDWPLSVDAAYSANLRAQQLPNATGTIALSGSLVQLEIVQTLDAPYALRVEAQVNDPLLAPQWQADLWIAGMQLTEFAQSLPPVGLSAELSAEGDMTQANINAELKIEKSTVQISGGVSFGGQFSDSPVVDLQLGWQQLVWPLDASKNYLMASDTGKARLSGDLDAYRATVDAQVAVPLYPTGKIEIVGAGNVHSFAVEQLALSTLGGDILGDATINWEDGVKTTFNLAGKSIDPAGLNANWPGSLNFTTQAAAAISVNGDLHALSGNLLIDGMVRNEPVSAEMTGQLNESGLKIPSFVVRALGTSLNAKGVVSTNVSQPMDLEWQLEMNDLGALTQGLTGNIQAEGRLMGTVIDPRIRASLTAADVSVAQVQFDRAALTTDLGLGAAPLSLNAEFDGLRFAGAEVEQLELDLSGTLAKHLVGLRTARDSGTSQLALSGSLSGLPAQGAAAPIAGWKNLTWLFSFDELDIDEGDIAIDLIQNSLPSYIGKVDKETIAIGDTCFSVSDARNPSELPGAADENICLQAAGTANELKGDITFNDLPLMLLNPVLPASTSLTGSLGGNVSLGWNVATGAPRAEVSLNTSAANLQTTNNQGVTQPVLQFEPGKLSASWMADSLFAVIELPLVGSAGLNATASIAAGQGDSFASRAIDASVITDFDDIDWLADFLQGVTQLSGKLESNLRVAGTISEPALDGNASLKNGKVVLPGPGLTLRELDVNFVGAGDEGLTLTGSVKSGGGTLSLAGQLKDVGSNMNGRISFTGERVLILNTPEAEIYASPAIDADLQQKHLKLVGEVSIDKATINLTSLPQTAATVSSDQIIVVKDAPVSEISSRFDVTTQLRLRLNDAVSFSGFGLEATFGGDLSLVDLPGKPTTANGDINVVAGQYRAYGQNLTIETGKLLFVGGPIDQPGIDIRAVRQVTADIKVGALARGNLRKPEFSVFSEPTMNQSDQLSYLVLGRPLSTSSSGESSVLSRAALALGIKGGNYLTEQFGSKLGVDKIGIETAGTNTNEQAALVVGKYLSPELFVSYGIGVIDAVSTLKIEYLLSSRWRVSSESSVDESGIDLNYVLER